MVATAPTGPTSSPPRKPPARRGAICRSGGRQPARPERRLGRDEVRRAGDRAVRSPDRHDDGGPADGQHDGHHGSAPPMILCIHQPPAASSASPMARQAQPISLPTRKRGTPGSVSASRPVKPSGRRPRARRGRSGLRGLSPDLTGERGALAQAVGDGVEQERGGVPAGGGQLDRVGHEDLADLGGRRRPAAGSLRECAAPIDRAQHGGQVGTGEPSASRRPLERLAERRAGSQAGPDLVRHRRPRRRGGPCRDGGPPNGRAAARGGASAARARPGGPATSALPGGRATPRAGICRRLRASDAVRSTAIAASAAPVTTAPDRGRRSPPPRGREQGCGGDPGRPPRPR